MCEVEEGEVLSWLIVVDGQIVAVTVDGGAKAD